jgi:hypothetical protein
MLLNAQFTGSLPVKPEGSAILRNANNTQTYIAESGSPQERQGLNQALCPLIYHGATGSQNHSLGTGRPLPDNFIERGTKDLVTAVVCGPRVQQPDDRAIPFCPTKKGLIITYNLLFPERTPPKIPKTVKRAAAGEKPHLEDLPNNLWRTHASKEQPLGYGEQTLQRDHDRDGSVACQQAVWVLGAVYMDEVGLELLYDGKASSD